MSGFWDGLDWEGMGWMRWISLVGFLLLWSGAPPSKGTYGKELIDLKLDQSNLHNRSPCLFKSSASQHPKEQASQKIFVKLSSKKRKEQKHKTINDDETSSSNTLLRCLQIVVYSFRGKFMALTKLRCLNVVWYLLNVLWIMCVLCVFCFDTHTHTQREKPSPVVSHPLSKR